MGVIVVENNFEIICKNCGSHDVSISSYDLGYISLECNDCGNLCECGYYNEGNISQEDKWGGRDW